MVRRETWVARTVKNTYICCWIATIRTCLKLTFIGCEFVLCTANMSRWYGRFSRSTPFLTSRERKGAQANLSSHKHGGMAPHMQSRMSRTCRIWSGVWSSPHDIEWDLQAHWTDGGKLVLKQYRSSSASTRIATRRRIPLNMVRAHRWRWLLLLSFFESGVNPLSLNN